MHLPFLVLPDHYRNPPRVAALTLQQIQQATRRGDDPTSEARLNHEMATGNYLTLEQFAAHLRRQISP